MKDRVRRAKKHATLDPAAIDEVTAATLFGLGEGRGSDWGAAAILAAIDDDADLKPHMILNLVNHARLVLKSKELFDGGGRRVWSKVWEKPNYDVGGVVATLQPKPRPQRPL